MQHGILKNGGIGLCKKWKKKKQEPYWLIKISISCDLQVIEIGRKWQKLAHGEGSHNELAKVGRK